MHTSFAHVRSSCPNATESPYAASSPNPVNAPVNRHALRLDRAPNCLWASYVDLLAMPMVVVMAVVSWDFRVEMSA